MAQEPIIVHGTLDYEELRPLYTMESDGIGLLATPMGYWDGASANSQTVINLNDSDDGTVFTLDGEGISLKDLVAIIRDSRETKHNEYDTLT